MPGFSYAYLQLLFKILARQTGQISKVEFVPQKPHYRNLAERQPFPRATPESQGVSSLHLKEYLEALADDREANPHHAIVIRHGKIIAECSYAPYENGMWHITHSMCKSVTGMAVGFAIEEGLLTLDEKIGDIFPQYVKLLARLSRKDVTIENLLDMTSGVSFTESGAITGNDWRTGFMSSSFRSEPGTKFEYNSMNSYMLSAAIQEKTGMTMFDYLKPRLFDPLGIDEVFWERCPQGITKGGWGMFIRPEDACKLGQLYLDGGRWKGKQILPASWVKASTSPHVDNGKFGYGYQIWMEERPGGFAFNGLFGQDVVCYPDLDMIVMINAGNREMTQSGSLTEIMRRFFGINYHPSDEPLPEDPEGQKALAECIRSFGAGHPAAVRTFRERLGLSGAEACAITPGELAGALKGRVYEMDKCQVGLFPLICQVMHNNFTDGISRIGFDEMDGHLFLQLYEGSEIHHIRVGFDRPEKSEILLHGEPYYVGTLGRVATDEDERAVLVLNISFIEEACSRELRLYFHDDEIELRADETPGNAVIEDALTYTAEPGDLLKLPFGRALMESGGMDLMQIAVQSAIHPTVHGHRVKSL